MTSFRFSGLFGMFMLGIIFQQIDTVTLSEPTVVLGNLQQGSFLNRAMDIAEGNGDTIYVFDIGDCVVVAFDGQGNEIVRFGREGAGPGEFRQPRQICFTGHSVLVTDYALSRIVEFSSQGEYLNTIRLSFQPRFGLVFYNDMIYAGVRSSEYLIVRFPLENPAEYSPVLTCDHPAFIELSESALFRNGGVELGESSNGLLAAFPSLGIYGVIPWESEPDQVTMLEPQSEYIEAERKAHVDTPTRYFSSIIGWPDGRIVLDLWDKQDEPWQAVCIFIDPATGRETGPRIVAPRRRYNMLHLLDDDRIAWYNLDDATVDIFSIPELKQ